MNDIGSLIRSLVGRPAARNFHSHVINEIGAGIAAGRYPVGSVLPNDAEMMVQFNVSRTVLREALKTLESKGLVEARPKVGTKVTPRSRWNHFDPMVLAWLYAAGLNATVLKQVGDLRKAIEPAAAGEVALSRTSDDIRLLHYWLRQMENSMDSPLNFALADLELHSVIVDATKNYFNKSLMGVIELAHASTYRHLIDEQKPVPQAHLAAHAELVKGIELSDAKMAKSAATAIIELEFGAV